MAKHKTSKKRPESSSEKAVSPVTSIPSPINYSVAPSMIPKSPAGVNIPNAPKQLTPEEQKAEFESLKASLEDFKKSVIKKYPFTIAMSLLPAQASPLIEEDEGVPKEIAETKPFHVVIVIPEEEFKNIPKIKPELVKFAQDTKRNFWIHIKTPVDIWNYGLDSKFEFMDAVGQGYPVYDKGFLGALRVTSIHKSLVLRKFDKYIASYAIGGSLVRGTAGKDSDIDVFVIVDDTDVKRLSRVELLEKLRGMINDYIREATALAGVKNMLSAQVWLLTDFWQRVKDAEPVAFTFIRDGIPLYDRGTFIPWKLLLKMGKIKPSSEAIDLYMKQGEQTEDFVKRRLLDAMVDIYYGIITPTQALMMLAGETSPVPKAIAGEAKKLFVDKEKVMAAKDLKTLEKAVYLFKQYEYGKLKEFSGSEVEKFLKEGRAYNVMLKGMRKKLEAKMQEKTAEEIYTNVFSLLKTIMGNKSQDQLVKDFETTLVKKGKIEQRMLPVLKELVGVKRKIKSGKLNQKEVDYVKKNAFDLISSLTEFAQRADLVSSRKGMMQIAYSGRKAELVLLGSDNFIIEGKEIRKIKDGSLVSSSKEEFEKSLEGSKGKLTTNVSAEVFKILEKTLGNFEISF